MNAGSRCSWKQGAWATVLLGSALGWTGACTAPRDFGDPAAAGAGNEGGADAVTTGGAAANEAGATGSIGERPCMVGEAESCYESANGVAYPGSPPEGQSTCRAGQRRCDEGGMWGVCIGAIGPQESDTCDAGNDASCNGVPNEGCGCDSGEVRACGTTDVGNCQKGEQTCVDEEWGECEGEIKEAAFDTCDDGDDANCNGAPNDTCSCINGTTEPCGDAGCGSRQCTGATGQWGACTGDGTTPRCNPNSPDSRQVCGANGAWVANDCPPGSVCRNGGTECKLENGQSCETTSQCATSTCSSFYVDADGDGYRKNATVLQFCGSSKGGHVLTSEAAPGQDCDDTKIAVNPGANEDCDGVDNDCDNLVDMADTDEGLTLSGTAQVIENGTDSAVASNGSLYGLTFSSSGKTYFATLNQSNSPVLSRKELDSVSTQGAAIAWDGSRFGIFNRVYGGEVYFRKASPTGDFSPASKVVVGSEGIGAQDATTAYMPGQGWWYLAWGEYINSHWVYRFKLSNNNVPGGFVELADPARYTNVAASGDRFGAVWNAGAYNGSGTQTLTLSIRDASGAEAASTTLGSTTGFKKAAIAARPGGGFAVMWNQGSTVYHQEVSGDATTLCGPITRTFSNFMPDQMVATSRGFLAVSGNAGVVKLQEVVDCKWGSNFPNIGTGSETKRAHIAGGASGFAVVWDQKLGSAVDVNIYSRTFGPNLCDD